jgi:hypothetical protein
VLPAQPPIRVISGSGGSSSGRSASPSSSSRAASKAAAAAKAASRDAASRVGPLLDELLPKQPVVKTEELTNEETASALELLSNFASSQHLMTMMDGTPK